MILVLFLLGDLLTNAFSTVCYDGCFCYDFTMNCTRQSLTDVPDIPDLVINVDLGFNLISEIEKKKVFGNLKELNLSYNRLKKIDLDLSKSYLEKIKISNNPIKELHINSKTLKFLDVSWCDINHLPADFLKMVPSLEVLDIGYNPLKFVIPLAGNLKQLYIQGSLLRDINFDLPSLQLLDVSFNRYMTKLKLESNLTTLRATHGSFQQTTLALPKLKFLDISHNKLSHAYFNNPNLEVLDISWNSLRSLDLIGALALKSLDLSHNLLIELELNLENLLFLNVSFNPLTELKVYPGPLNMVDCASCQLKNIQLPQVHTLNLSRNNLEDFKEDCAEAIHLDLSHNLLNSFKGSTKFVDLRGNRLSLPKNIKISGNAMLSNNPWLCKCEDNALKELYLKAIDKVTCASPEGKTWETCFTTKLPKYMKDYPWVPLAASALLTLIVVIGIYILKRKLWSDMPSPQISQDFEETQPVRERLEDRLPSYEEALLMKKPRYSNPNNDNRRSYEIVPNRRLSSSSI